MWGPVAYAGDVHHRFGYEKYERLLIGVGSPSGMFFSYGTNTLGTSSTTANRRGIGGDVFDESGLPTQIDSNRLSSVRSPSEFIVIAETVADGVGDFQVFPRNINLPPGVEHSPATIHRGGANVLFCDGHVQWFLKKDLVIACPAIPQESVK